MVIWAKAGKRDGDLLEMEASYYKNLYSDQEIIRSVGGMSA